jgi:tetratricopeptide (TPR) repeat protein
LTIIQASLAVVTGVAFTDAFWRWLDRVAPSRLEWGLRPKLHATGAFAALTLIGVVYFALPAIARLYNDYGEEQREMGAVSQAVAAFNRAIALDPDLAAAQYNLGSAYEMVHENDRAASAYQAAVLLDPTLTRAQNNLARLAIINSKQVLVALLVMDGLVKSATAQGAKATPDVLSRIRRMTE